MVKFLALLWFLTIFSSCFATIDIFRKFFKKGGHQKNQVQYYPVAMQPARNYLPQPALYGSYDSYETMSNDEGGKYHWLSKLKPWSHKEYQPINPMSNVIPNINSGRYGPPSAFPTSYFPPPSPPSSNFGTGILNYPKLEPPPLQQSQPLPQPPTVINSNDYKGDKLDYGTVAYYLVPGFEAMPLKPQLIYGTPIDSKGSEGEGMIGVEMIANENNRDVKCD